MSFLAKLKTALIPKRYGYYPNNLHSKAPMFLDLVNSGNFKGAQTLFYTECAAEQSYLVEAASDLVIQDDFYDDWFDGSNGPPLACLFRGAFLTQRAWQYRGWGRGEDVKNENAKMMFLTLEKARNSLEPILGNPDLGQYAAGILIRVLMGLSADWEEIDEMLLALRSYPQPHLPGEINYLVASCEKWLGSHEKMHAFANETAIEFADFPEIGGLCALAHWERQLYFDNFDEDEQGGTAYANNLKVLNDVKFRSECLLNHRTSKDPQAIRAHNAFSAFFCDREEWDLAKPHFQIMKSRVCRHPWSFYDEKYLNQVYNISML